MSTDTTPIVTQDDTASISLANATQATGNVLSNDSDPDGDTLSVATVDGLASDVGTVITGLYGTLTLNANGTYTYVANSAETASLSPGQTVQDVFQYTVSDGNDHSVTTTTVTNENLITWSEAFDNAAWVKFAYTGSNPTVTANVAAGPSGGAATADQVTLAGVNRGLYFLTDASGQYTFSVWVKLVSGDGHFDLNYYDGSASHPVEFVATSSWQRVTLSFTGSGAQYENVALMHGGSETGTGTFDFWGAQLNPGASATTYLPTSGSVATTTTTTTTTPTFGANLTINITAPSAAGSTSGPPIANPDFAAVKVGVTGQASGNVLTNDTDPGNHALTVATVDGQAAAVGTTIQGIYGSLVLQANGQYTYVLANNAAVQGLAAGQVATDTFDYTVSDGQSHPITTTVTNVNLITQSEAFDSSVWIPFADSGTAPTVTANVAAGPNGGAATADQVTLAGVNRGLYYITNASSQYTFSVWVKLVSGDGHFDLNYYDGSTSHPVEFVATSSWQRVTLTFDGSGSQYGNVAIMHDGGETGTGVFQIWGAQLNPGPTAQTYVATNGAAGSSTTTTTQQQVSGSELTINVEGPAVSAPPIAVADSATAPATGPLAGNVLSNDISQSGGALTVTAVNGSAADVGASIAGTYGSLVLNANGSYTYQETPGLSLAPGESATDYFQYTVSDGTAYTLPVTTMTGENILRYSEAFDNSVWVKFSAGTLPTVTANVAAGPNGGASTADQIVLPGGVDGIYESWPIAGQATYSIWVRLVSGDGHFDLNYYDGTSSHSTTFVASSTWQRYSITFTGNNLGADNVAFMHDASQTASGTFQIWGAQLNPGATATTYTPTTSHLDATFTTTTPPATSTADLAVTVQGPDPASITPGTLTFAGSDQGVVVNLASAQWSDAMTVLPLGDSITYGWTALDSTPGGQTNTEDGYRGPLWWDFANAQSLINFVGPNTSGDALLPSQSEAGYPGYRSDQIAALLPGILSTSHPDAILLMAGDNDIFHEVSPAAHVAASTTQMLDLVNSVSPNTEVYVATLMPINQAGDPQPGDAAMVATVNAAITQAVSQAQALGIHVTLVDTSSITLSNLADADHPNAAGYADLANIWYNAILAQQPLNGGTPDGTAHAIPSNVTTVIGSNGNDLLIAGSANVTLIGGAGNDRLVAGSGADTLTGGAGADQFVVSLKSGATTITDFNQSQGDHIELDGFGLTQFSQISSDIHTSGSSTVIDLTSLGGHTITLQNFAGTLSASDFFFA